MSNETTPEHDEIEPDSAMSIVLDAALEYAMLLDPLPNLPHTPVMRSGDDAASLAMELRDAVRELEGGE